MPPDRRKVVMGITLDPEVAKMLDRVSKKLRYPKAHIINDLLKVALPYLDNIDDVQALIAGIMSEFSEVFKQISQFIQTKEQDKTQGG